MVEALKGQFTNLSSFERDFPSLCFALATGVGKTRLMGAFISYLHAAYGYKHFFVLAPNLTIYDKLIRDFTPGTPKYVFKSIAEFATAAPEVITGETYEQRGDLVSQALDAPVQINIFNISKINTEVRGGKTPRIKLMDGLRVHEQTKVHLLTYAQQKGAAPVKPFMLVIARDTTHAAALSQLLAAELFDGRYAGKVIQVDSGTTSGAEGGGIVQRLLAVNATLGALALAWWFRAGAEDV